MGPRNPFQRREHGSTNGSSSQQQSGANGPSSTPRRRSPRQLWWGGLLLASMIAMGSTFEAVRMQRHFTPPNIPPTPSQRWAISSATLTFLLTFLSLALQLIPQTSHLLIGTKLELFSILFLMGFTAAATGTATNPATGLAVNASGGVSFGNLYYSTWASFGCAFALLLSFMRTERGLDVSNELLSRGRRFRSWVVLIVTALIVMGSSASAYDAQCDVGEDVMPKKYCRRAALGVSVGCIGCVVSLAVVAMRLSCASTSPREEDGGGGGKANRVIFTIEGVCSVVLFCTYGFAVAYLTSEKGPGAPLGNLYYSSWITFGITFFVATSCFEEFQSAKAMILSGRQQQQQHHPYQQGGGSDERERLAPNVDEFSIAVTDQGRMGAGPVDWSERSGNTDGDWNYGGEKEQGNGQQAFGKVSSSVGEVQLEMD